MINDTKYKWAVIENLIIYALVGGGFLITRSPWCFVLLLFVNMPGRAKKN